MTIESFSLIEHFDYMRNYVPQPFEITPDEVESLVKGAEEYQIKTTKGTYSLTMSTIKKLVDALGIKIKLLSCVASEVDVIDLVMPALNKLFKCYSDCFVFYASQEDAYKIIDLNVNSSKGEPESKYEFGPSPWTISAKDSPSSFTCFADFMFKYNLDSELDRDIQVKADDIMSGKSQVTLNLFKAFNLVKSNLRPMLTFSSKFSNMDGFSEIHPTLFDESTGIYITFPMNYAKYDGASFDDIWQKVMHIYDTTDTNDYIFREVNELSASNDTPSSLSNFISTLMNENIINLNQPLSEILNDANKVMNDLKPAKRNKFSKNMGALIAYCLIARHSCCEHCGHLEIR